MFILFFLFFMVFLIAFLLGVIAGWICNYSLLSSSKSSPFECGFAPKFMFRPSFSIQFFMIALLFLIFDMELVLLYPVLSMGGLVHSFYSFFFVFAFFTMLLVGLFHEWNQGGLEWSA